MSDEGDRDREFEDLDQPEQHLEKLVAVTVSKGQSFIKHDQLLESVILAPTASRTFYMQAPSVFAADGQDAAKTTKQNDNYEKACKKMQEPGQAVNVEIQTLVQTEVLNTGAVILTKTAYAKEKGVGTCQQTFKDQAVEVNYVDIMSLIKEEEVTLVQQPDDVEFKKKQEGGIDFDDVGTAYTKTEGDDVSEAGTAYTTGTQKTADQSIGQSIGSTIGKDDDEGKGNELRKQRLQSFEGRIFNDPKFVKSMLLAELLVQQNPLITRICSYRAQDVQYDPDLDYGQILRSEFTVSKDNTQVSKKTPLQLKQLYIYKSPLMHSLKVVCLDFSPIDERLLAVGYADTNSAPSDEHYGAIAVWQPENPTHPKIHFFTRQQITSLAWLPLGKSVVSVGFSDGCVAVYDFRHLQIDSQGYAVPNLESNNKTGKHTSKVWDCAWVAGDTSSMSGDNVVSTDYDNLITVSADGRVVERSVKRSFEYRDILTLTSVGSHPVAIKSVDDKKSTSNRMTIIRKLSAGLSIDFLPDQSTYLVSGDDAVIRKASRAYSEQTLMQYTGHLSSIYRVRVNPCTPGYFLSCSADRTTKIWNLESQQALVSLRSPSEEHVYTAEWCPYKSTVILTGTKAGTVELWDLTETTVSPMKVIDRLQFKKKTDDDEEEEKPDEKEEIIPVRVVQFNKKVPVFAVGYENGFVYIYRLTGVENGYIFKNVDQANFLEVESERIAAVVQQQEGAEE
ncbi:Dynein intermediate chain [Spironucleus salmonicida]|uniref:Dynein axonemal intermediate chain 4 n=1 Tax=Spironucleus salmonicida TaxID=348837 RepID=V6M0E5_9EUKA|nr:Dynein intermediate chain [Spironucleus salmonicida]|eukprot:EST46604.1 Dynein intermediate chain [Spironucleus salmonicida]